MFMRNGTALSGCAFVLLFAGAAALYGTGAGSDAADILNYYASPADRRHQEYGFAMLLLGCLLLVHYLAVLRARLAGSQLAATVMLLSGGSAVVLLMISNALWAASAFTVEIQGGSAVVNPSAHLLVEDAAFVVLVTAAAAAIPMVIVTCTEVLRQRSLPKWFVGLGWLSVLGLAAAYWYFPLLPFLVWVAAGSVLLALRPQDSMA